MRGRGWICGPRRYYCYYYDYDYDYDYDYNFCYCYCYCYGYCCHCHYYYCEGAYASCARVVAELRRAPEVEIHALGVAAAEHALHVCAVASPELRKASGFLPGFGRLALRLDRYDAPPEFARHTLAATLGRLVDLPEPAGRPLLMSRSAEAEEAGEWLARALEGGGCVAVRCVGAAAAHQTLRALRLAQERLGTPLCLSPALGASLSSTRLDRVELVSSICRWSSPASPLPEPPAARQRHRADFRPLPW